MQRRNWLREVSYGLLFALGMAACVLLSVFLNAGRSCYNRIQVGMPGEDAVRIIKDSGFTLTGGEGNLGQLTLVFTRRKTDPAIIVVIDGWTGRVRYKELDSAPDRFLQSSRNFLRNVGDD